MRKPCRLFTYLFFLLVPLLVSSQSIKEILTNDEMSVEQKEIQASEILNSYKSNKNFDSLFHNNYEVIKWYRKIDSLDKAIALNKENLELMISSDYNDPTFIRKNIFSLGFYQNKNGNNIDALETFSRLLNYEEPDSYAISATFKMAEIYFVERDHYKALEYYKLCKSISESLNDDFNIIRATIGIGQTSTRINTTKSLKNGIDITTKTIARIESNELACAPDWRFKIYKLLGNLHSDRTDYNFELAEKHLLKALEIAETIDNPYELVNIYNDLGFTYLMEKDERAESYLMKALDIGPYGIMYTIVTRNLANHHLNAENFDQALQYAQLSLSDVTNTELPEITALPTKDVLKNVNEKLHVVSTLDTKVDIWIELAHSSQQKKDYYFEQALKTIELADDLIDLARIENIDLKSKLFWRKTATDLYIKATEVCYDLKKPEAAFYYIEKNKALVLLEDIAIKTLRNNSEASKDLIEQEQLLRDKISALEKQKNNTNSDELQRDLLLAKADYDAFINSLSTDNQIYFKTHQPAKVLALDVFQSQYLNDKTAYLEYILDDKDGYGLLITKTSRTLFKIEAADSLKSMAITYRSLIDKPFKTKTDIERFTRISHKMYNALIPSEIRDIIKDKTLTIIPDYYLQNIPFEPLCTQQKDLSYLIYDHQVNYAYSLSFLAENNKIERKNNNPIVAFAPIEFESLEPLPYTEYEISVIDSIFNAETYSNEKATKANFFKHTNDYQIIHIASHANASDSISPKISFYDDVATLNELYNFNNSAELVVLSACNTSLGELYKGEGVMSLSRGFFNAGSKSVMPTLWEVNDRTTLNLVESFYSNLKNGQDKSLALHNAKLNYLESNSLSDASPYYWASFVLIGDSGEINLVEKTPLYIWGILIIFCVLIFILLKKNKKLG
ncbi:CHAT domain-containing protein [Winogradskyella tangerina]|uniref:CHAT domain-containing protein n=1 Tax=Winogradskyella tangerina TaxID=2023240 RepID=UPI000DBE97D6|nr:CHAT domain-containing protein [Winogradskyella tangerina]